MLYPYTHQFILYDDIKDSLTGFGRFMYYRCLAKNRLGDYDPTFDAEKQNWIMEIKEGQFEIGEANGYQRQLSAYNGHCRLGYFRNNEPFGKYVEYTKDGSIFQKEGIYLAGRCIKEEPIDSFDVNKLPEDAVQYIDDADLVPLNYHLNRKGSRLIGNGDVSQTSFVSDISNLTAKE
jgi:hypothetical protein